MANAAPTFCADESSRISTSFSGFPCRSSDIPFPESPTCGRLDSTLSLLLPLQAWRVNMIGKTSDEGSPEAQNRDNPMTEAQEGHRSVRDPFYQHLCCSDSILTLLVDQRQVEASVSRAAGEAQGYASIRCKSQRYSSQAPHREIRELGQSEPPP